MLGLKILLVKLVIMNGGLFILDCINFNRVVVNVLLGTRASIPHLNYAKIIYNSVAM